MSIIDSLEEGTVILENPSYESAIVGVTEDNRLVYCIKKMVKFLMDKDGMSEEDALEFINYNTIRALPYMENSPIILYPIKW